MVILFNHIYTKQITDFKWFLTSYIYGYVDIFKNPHQPNHLIDEEKVFVPLKAGDATFHSGLTFHGAANNQTNEMREAMTIIYIKDGVTFDASDERNKTHTSCLGINNGDIINTKFTPVLI